MKCNLQWILFLYNRCAITNDVQEMNERIEISKICNRIAFKTINDEIEDIKRRVAELEAAQ